MDTTGTVSPSYSGATVIATVMLLVEDMKTNVSAVVGERSKLSIGVAAAPEISLVGLLFFFSLVCFP